MRTVSTVLGGIALAVAVLTPNIAKAANLITNGDFEDQNAPVNEWGFTTLAPGATDLTGWTVTKGTIDIVPASYWLPSVGGHSIDLTGTPGQGGISQSFTTIAGATYLLAFALAPNPEAGLLQENFVNKVLDVRVTSSGGSTLGFEEYDLSVGDASRRDMRWHLEGFTFTAIDTLTTLKFESMGNSLFTGPVIDNVFVDLAPGGLPPPDDEGGPRVPEPASLAIVGLGALGLLKRRSK